MTSNLLSPVARRAASAQANDRPDPGNCRQWAWASFLLAWVMLLLPGKVLAQAEGPAFSCDGTFYQIRQTASNGATNRSVLYKVDRTSSTLIYDLGQKLGVANGTDFVVNSLGYNPKDGFMYALSYPPANSGFPTVRMYIIGQTGVRDLGAITLNGAAVPVNTLQLAGGTIALDGKYYASTRSIANNTYQNSLFVFDLTAPTTAGKLNATTLALKNAAGTADLNTGAYATGVTVAFIDLAFNPKDGLLYGTYENDVLYQFDLTAAGQARVTQKGSRTNKIQNLGSAFFDLAGNLFAYANEGFYYLINTTTGATTQISTQPTVAVTDGASCIYPDARIDVVKEVTSVVPTVTLNQYDVAFAIRVKNTGTQTTNNVQVNDFLTGGTGTTFPTATAITIPGGVTVTNLGSTNVPTLAANTTYSGNSSQTAINSGLLTGAGTLTAGQSALITFTARVTFPSAPTTPSNNSAYASSTSNAAGTVNVGYSLLADGTPLPPANVFAVDVSTNSAALPNSPNGDTPSATPVYFTPAILGNVFEDVDYGGGIGRSQAASNGKGSVARVELYTAAGTFIAATNSDVDGNYVFVNNAGGLGATTLVSGVAYQVRVVNNTVVSNRIGGATAGLIPVQTFISNGVTPDVNRVGGVAPNEQDYGNITTGVLPLSAASTTQEVQSITTVTLPITGPRIGVDFGYNFDLVVNTNDAGQGSLRQFILNSNALGDEVSLAQSGSNTAGTLPAGTETSIFMIPDGAAHSGQVAGLPNGINGTGGNAGAAVITLQQALPAITGANTSLDATTQTLNIGNSNAGTVGTGGTVGVDGLALSTIPRPEVVINANGTTQPLQLQGNAEAVKGLALYNANGTNGVAALTVSSAITGVANRAELSQLLLGSLANGTDPGAALRNTFGALELNGSFNVTNNFLAFNGNGIGVGSSTTATVYPANAALITNNDFYFNGGGLTYGDNLSLNAANGVQVSGNLMRDAQGGSFAYTGKGIELFYQASNNTIANNTITGSATAGIGIEQNSSNNTISRNIISGTVGTAAANSGPGILMGLESFGGLGSGLPSVGNTITQNNIFDNHGLSIDLVNSSSLGDGVTLNDNGDADAGPNTLLNYPVITSATISGGRLFVKGYARAGSLIELFATGTADASGFGEGRTYLGTVTEGSAADLDNTINQSYSGFINGINQGADNSASGFSFSIPVSSLTGGTLAARAVLSSTATLAGSTSEFSGNVTVRDITVANDDDVTTPINTVITIAATANDTPVADLVAGSIDLNPSTPAIDNSITTPEGTFTTVGVPAGSVKFTPVSATFTGIANTPYTVQNASGATSNQANLIVRVEAQLDIATTISAPGTVVAGAQITVTGTSVNNSLAGTGNAAIAQSLQLPVGIPTGSTIVVNGANQTVSAALTANGLFTFGNASVAPGGSAAYSLRFTAPLTGPFTVTALANPTAADINQANNTAVAIVFVTPQTDLVTTITGPTTNPLAGNLTSYTVTTGNGATSSPATGVVQTVQLPTTGITGVYASNGGVYSATAGTVTFGGVSYSVAAGTVTFPPVNLAAGQVVNNTVSFVAPAAGTVLNNITATVPTTNDPATGNNTATAASVTTQAATAALANLYVTITGPTTTDVGSTATYTVTQGNNGPSAASTVQTVVALPIGLTASTLTSVGGVAGTQSGTLVTFGTGGPVYDSTTGLLTLAAISTQASAAVVNTNIVLQAPAVASLYTVTASVGSATTDPVPGDNVATIQTDYVPKADVAITLTTPAGAGNINAGQTVLYNVQTQNLSTYVAQNVQPTVVIQAGLSAATLLLNGATGTLAAGVITFGSGTTASTYNVSTGLVTLPLIGALPKGLLVNTAISFPAPGNTSRLAAVATVTSLTPDNVATNNTASLSNGLNLATDLTVSIAGPTQVVAGSQVLYSVTTTNNGPSGPANGATTETTTVQLPTGLTAVEVRDNSGTIVAGAYNATTGVVTFATTTVVPSPGQSVQGTISFLAPDVTQLSLDAAVALTAPSSGNVELNADNNTARISTTVNVPSLANADLATVFTPTPAASLAPGATASYTFVTTNNSAATAQNPVQRVSLPVGLSAATLTLGGTTGTLAAGVITFSNGATYNVSTGLLTVPSATALAGAGTLSNTVTFPMPLSTITVVATAASDNPDGTSTNNIARATTTATQSADVVLGMTGPAFTTAGSAVNYTVTAINNGPSTATSVTVKFTLPAGVTDYSVNGTAQATVPAGSQVTLNPSFQALVSGGSLAYLVSFTAPTAGSFTATSQVTTTSLGNNAANDNGSVQTLENIAPQALDIVNTLQSPEGSTAVTALPLSSLSASDADGSVANYKVTVLPTSGTLYYNTGTLAAPTYAAVVANTPYTDPANFAFIPAAGYVGSVFFTYTATDNGNGTLANALTSAPARYTIQVGKDNNSVYTKTPVKGGNANKYATGDVLAYGIDPNGAAYNTAGLVYDPNGAAPTSGTGTVSNGISIARISAADSTVLAGYGIRFMRGTGLFTVLTPTLLPRAGVTLPPITVTTRDLNSGINTNVVTLTTGVFPLPVELTDFTASAVRNLDASLLWHTAQEKNNDHFDVERSLNGTDYVKIGTVQGQGSKTTPTEYALTDAGIGPKAKGLVYYRLKQVDTDGETSYSPVRTVNFTATLVPAISLFPNPATGGTQLDLTQMPTGRYQVSVLDATGRVVLHATLDAGLAHALDLNTIASGTYNVLVRGQGNGQPITLTKRLIKE